MAATGLQSLLANFCQQFASVLHLPEYRGVEMYSARRRVAAPGRGAATEARLDPECLPLLDGPWHLYHVLEAELAMTDGQLEGLTSWQRYQSLPRQCMADKLVAECFRLLRIIRIVLQHPQGHLKQCGGHLNLTSHANAYPLFLEISPVGLALLQSLICYYLTERGAERVGPAYLDAMLHSYFTDLVGEIRGFEDEDRVLCQFRPHLLLNRHWRLDCFNPRFLVEEGCCVLQLAPRFADGTVHPIDFHLRLNDGLYRIPMEAMHARPDSGSPLCNAIRLDELAGWRRKAGAATDEPSARPLASPSFRHKES